jgi:hypothetical protein
VILRLNYMGMMETCVFKVRRCEAEGSIINLQDGTVSQPEEQNMNTLNYLVCSVEYLFYTMSSVSSATMGFSSLRK